MFCAIVQSCSWIPAWQLSQRGLFLRSVGRNVVRHTKVLHPKKNRGGGGGRSEGGDEFAGSSAAHPGPSFMRQPPTWRSEGTAFDFVQETLGVCGFECPRRCVPTHTAHPANNRHCRRGTRIAHKSHYSMAFFFF